MQRIKSQNTWVVLGCLTLIAALLRFWALGFGGDQLARPDEQNVAQAIIHHLMMPWDRGEPALNPKFFEYPSLYLYKLSGLYWIKYWLGLASGQWSNLEQYRLAYLDHPGQWYLLGRIYSALTGALTVPLTALLAWRLTGRRWAIPLAGLLMAFAYLAVREAHFGVTDTYATFWVVMTLVATAIYQTTTNPASRAHWLNGALILAGAAAGSKYPAGLVTLAPLTAFWLSPTAPAGLKGKLLGLPPLVAIAFAAFLTTTPYAVWDFHTFWRDFSYQMAHMANGHGLDVGIGWIRHATFTLPVGVGWPMLGLAALALVRFVLKPTRTLWPLVIFMLAYYGWVGHSKTVFVRYMLPLVPVLAVLATVGLAHMSGWLTLKLTPAVKTTRFKPKLVARLTLFLLAVLAIIANLNSDLVFLKLLNRPDTREQAAQWLTRNLPADQGVGVGMFLSHVQLPPHISGWTLAPAEDHSMGTNPYGRGFVMPQQWMGQQRPDLPNQWLTNSYTEPVALCQRGVTQVVLSQSPLQLYSAPPFEIDGLQHNPDVRLLKTWRGMDRPASNYDAIDAFFLPYRLTFGEARQNPDSRPGPTLRLFGWDCPTIIEHYKPAPNAPKMPRLNPNAQYQPPQQPGSAPIQPQPMPTVPLPLQNGQPPLDPNHPSLPLQGAPPPPLSQGPPTSGQRLIPMEVQTMRPQGMMQPDQMPQYRPPNGYPQPMMPSLGMPAQAMPPGPGSLSPELPEGYH